MAERRMFAKKITESDAFLDMPLSAQCLYFHLNMAADDDGFVNNHRRIRRTINASEDDYRLLILKSFIVEFESGIIVIKHWKMHNYIQNDRYKKTDYQEEMNLLTLDNKKEYHLSLNEMDTKCIQSVSVGKDRLGKDRLGKDSIDIYTDAEASKPVKHKYGEYQNVLLTDDELEKLKDSYPDWEQRIENLSNYIASKGAKYKSHYATIKNWARKETPKAPVIQNQGRLDWIDNIDWSDVSED